MLKIKDNIDFKELEKFGFKLYSKDYIEYYYVSLDTTGNEAQIKIASHSKKMIIDTGATHIKGLAVIADLIQAGLVEKVVE